MIRRSTLVLIVLIAAVSVALFSVKYRVQALEEELARLNAEIVRDREALEVLRAEWSHLNNPIRLRQLAETYLEMGPIATDHVKPLAGLDDVLAFKAPTGEVAAREPDPESRPEMLQ